MPVKPDTYTKYALRTLDDLQALSVVLTGLIECAKKAHLPVVWDVLWAKEKVLANRIATEHAFLTLISQQTQLSAQALTLSCQIQKQITQITMQIVQLQGLLRQKQSEIRHILDTQFHGFYGGKKALSTRLASPRAFNISL